MGLRDDLLAIPDEVLRRGEIASAALVQMDFATGTRRWWAGFGALVTAGYTWQGVGDLIAISPIPAMFDLAAEAVTFDLAPTPEMMPLLQDQEANVTGRPVTVMDQWFAIPAWQPLLPPIVAFRGTMESLEFGAEGATGRTLRLNCEGQFVRRNAPPRGRLTDLDQRARHPGDRGCERVPLHKDREVRWS